MNIPPPMQLPPQAPPPISPPPISPPMAPISAPPVGDGRSATPEDIERFRAFFATPRPARTVEMFRDMVLACPPIEEFAKFENVPGRRGEQRHVPAKYMYQIADAIFDSWDVIFKDMQILQGSKKPVLVISVELHVKYPTQGDGLHRIMYGTASGSIDQTTPTEAIRAMAIKNALRTLGDIFGRGLYSDLDFSDTIGIETNAFGLKNNTSSDG